MKLRAALLASLVLAASCTSERAPPPQPVARPQPRPLQIPPPPRPAPAPAPIGWADLPLTPGQWQYFSDPSVADSMAVFSASSDRSVPPLFVISCDRGRSEIWLTRGGASAGANMTIRTSSGARTLPIRALPGGDLFAGLPARDPFLDNMIFSRGRFSADLPGMPMLVVPAWAEPARVVEDCRR